MTTERLKEAEELQEKLEKLGRATEIINKNTQPLFFCIDFCNGDGRIKISNFLSHEKVETIRVLVASMLEQAQKDYQKEWNEL